MKKTIKIIAAFLVMITLSANATSSDVKVVDNKAKAKVILDNYEANWNTLGAFTDSEVLTNILNERGVESLALIERSVVYTKDGETMMVVLDENGMLYEFLVSQCNPNNGTAPKDCGCCSACNGFAPYDLNGDGDCNDEFECSMFCSGPGF